MHWYSWILEAHSFIECAPFVWGKLSYQIQFHAGPCDNWVMESPCFYKPCRGWSCKPSSLSSSFTSLNNAKPQKVHKTGFNHYSTECLVKAGGREEGVMDFVQYVYSSSNPFLKCITYQYQYSLPILTRVFHENMFFLDTQVSLAPTHVSPG